MPASTSLKKLPLCVLVAALCGAGQSAYAHTTVKDKTVTEGSSTYTATVIGHGCNHPSKVDANNKPLKIPVVAHSVVVPTASPVLTRSDGGTQTSLGEVIQETDGSLAGNFSLVQDRDIFHVEGEKTDANGNVIGFFGKAGKLDTTLTGLVPFRFSAPKFKTDSCVNNLKIVLAVADICKMDVFPPNEHTANLWIPGVTTTYADADVHGIGEATSTITVKRDTGTNPLPGACGAGYDLTIEPSDGDVDTNLRIPGWRNK